MAAIYDDTGDVLSAASGVEIGTTLMSLSFWFKPTWAHTDNADHNLFRLPIDASNVFFFDKFSDNTLYCGWVTASTDHRVTVASNGYTISANAWHHFALTCNDTANLSELWLDGTKIGTKNTLVVASTIASAIYLGNRTAPDTDLRGKLAKFGIYNVILSDANIATLYSGAAVTTGLTHFWPLQTDAVATVGGVNLTNTNVTFDSDAPPSPAGSRLSLGMGLRL